MAKQRAIWPLHVHAEPLGVAPVVTLHFVELQARDLAETALAGRGHNCIRGTSYPIIRTAKDAVDTVDAHILNHRGE